MKQVKNIKIQSAKISQINVDIELKYNTITTNKLKATETTSNGKKTKKVTKVEPHLMSCMCYFSEKHGLISPWLMEVIKGTNLDIRNRIKTTNENHNELSLIRDEVKHIHHFIIYMI